MIFDSEYEFDEPEKTIIEINNIFATRQQTGVINCLKTGGWLMAKSKFMVLQEQQLIIPLHNFIRVLYDSF